MRTVVLLRIGALADVEGVLHLVDESGHDCNFLSMYKLLLSCL